MDPLVAKLKQRLGEMTPDELIQTLAGQVEKRGRVGKIENSEPLPKGRVGDLAWSDILRERLKKQGLQFAEDEIFDICVSFAHEVALQEIRREREQMAREKSETYNLFRNFRAVLVEFMEGMHLGPYDEIVSVAIRGADGNIRVEHLDRPDPQ